MRPPAHRHPPRRSEWQRWRMHRRTSRVTAELVIESLIRLQTCGRPAQHPLLQRTQPLPEGHRVVKAAQFVLQRDPYGLGLVHARTGGLLLGEVVYGLATDVERHTDSCV